MIAGTAIIPASGGTFPSQSLEASGANAAGSMATTLTVIIREVELTIPTGSMFATAAIFTAVTRATSTTLPPNRVFACSPAVIPTGEPLDKRRW